MDSDITGAGKCLWWELFSTMPLIMLRSFERGMVGLFCCVINSPITSLILAIEIFGSANLLPFAIVIAFCNVLSGYVSLYQAQKFVYSKTSPEFINRDAK